MNPNIAANQQRLFLAFLAGLRPHVRRDSSLPRRIKDLFARHRAIGSRDRKLYRELVYTYLRFLPWIDDILDTEPVTAAKIIAWLAPDLKPTSAYRAAHCGDWPPVPATLAEKAAVLSTLVGPELRAARSESTPVSPLPTSPSSPAGIKPALAPLYQEGCHDLPRRSLAKAGVTGCVGSSAPRFLPEALLPAWFQEHCPAAFTSPHLDALNSRANIWVRIQAADRNLVLDEFRAQGWTLEQPADYPDALCLPPNAEVAASDAYRRGFVEIQDLGSQLVLAHAPKLSGRWLDACAGAGGKTLQLARMLGAAGQVDATDIRVEILDELDDRAKRARLDNITIVQKPADVYDGVLVDAPCSGSGTWRRQPHLKWYVKPETIAAFTKTQREILATNAPRVKPRGLLIYATCSLSHHENHDVVAAFLKAHPAFTAEKPVQDHGGSFDGHGTTLLPGTRNTDGFYVALLRHA